MKFTHILAFLILPAYFFVRPTQATIWSFDADTSSKQNRMQIAQSLLDHYKIIDASIPNLKPEEKEWLLKEKRDVNSLHQAGKMGSPAYAEKYRNMWNSKEYHFDILKEKLESIMQPLRLIAKDSSKRSLRSEMALWAEVVYRITYSTNDIDNAFNFLKKENLLNAEAISSILTMPSGNDYWYYETVYANTIQGEIILPYLKGHINR
jgi:hypothetical protein